ncbi:hypothetical protein M422DRAFT_256476 [Sphaerobolus stellatus SS14]|uniref:Uncharacterized protein n=1 Tax=Sphaerobolus stellatus (strain SS14) TaxID=990650 RepID=A0A0C9V097_SPHS4|nr:hypothetical protein M422DRAFT_256476 [Sphaerobolus stellatus SS14]
MPRGPVDPPAMCRFHVKGLPPPPAIYAPTSLHLRARSSVDLHAFCHLQASPSTSMPYTRTHPSVLQPARHAPPTSPRFKHTPASTSCACTCPFMSCLHAMCKGATAPPPRRHVSARHPSASAPCAHWFFDPACVARSSTRQPPLHATCMHAGAVAL